MGLVENKIKLCKSFGDIKPGDTVNYNYIDEFLDDPRIVNMNVLDIIPTENGMLRIVIQQPNGGMFSIFVNHDNNFHAFPQQGSVTTYITV